LITRKQTFINWAGKTIVAGNFPIFTELSMPWETLLYKQKRVFPMRFFVATLLAAASILAPVAGFAESADVEATIKKVELIGELDNFLGTRLRDGR